MKSYGIVASVALSINCPAFSTASAIKDQFSANAINLAEHYRQQRLLADGHDDKKFNPYDNGAGGGCTCSGEAVRKISHAHTEATQKLPLVTLALLDDIANSTDPKTINGLTYDPLQSYEDISAIVESLVVYGTQIILQIDCNTCGVDGSADTNATTTSLPPTRRRQLNRQLGTITPYEDISNYECCCDVDAIRDLVISRIHDFYEKGLMNPEGDAFMRQAVESLFNSAVEAIQLLSAIYLTQHQAYIVPSPVFPGFN